MGDLLVLSAGDCLFGYNVRPSERDLERAKLILDLYKQMGYAVIGIGEKDLAGSVPFLIKEMEERGLTGVSCNLKFEGKRSFKPYVVLKAGGTNVGILAVTSPNLSPYINREGIEVLDPVSQVKAFVPEIKKKAKVIVLLSNLGVNEDMKLAKDVEDLDMIIGSGRGGIRKQDTLVGKIHILRTQYKGKGIGVAKISLQDGRIAGLTKEQVYLSGTLPEDEETAKKVAGMKVQRTVSPGAQQGGQQRTQENPFTKLSEELKRQQQTGQQQEGARQLDKSAIEQFLKALEDAKKRQQEAAGQQAPPAPPQGSSGGSAQ